MHMEVGPQLLVPRVQHERETDFAAQFLAAKSQERLSRCVKQQLEQAHAGCAGCTGSSRFSSCGSVNTL